MISVGGLLMYRLLGTQSKNSATMPISNTLSTEANKMTLPSLEEGFKAFSRFLRQWQ